MSRLLLIQTFTLVTFFCSGQKDYKTNSDSTLKSFIADATNGFFLKQTNYVELLDTFTLSSLKQTISKGFFTSVSNLESKSIPESVSLSKDEISNINSLLDIQDMSWLTANFPKTILVTSEQVHKLNIGTVFTLSKPIFLQNNSLCLFYIGYDCGPLCGSWRLSFYIKYDNKWVEYLNIYSLAS